MEEEKGFFLRFETFREIGEGLERVLSPTAASILMGLMGESCGRRACAGILGEAGSMREALQRLSSRKEEENWGKLTFRDVDFERGSGRIVVEDSFEARGLRGVREGPSCHFFSGFFRGFLSGLFGKTIMVAEERCVARGDPRCEFRFASSATFYAEEAVRERNRVIEEMALEHAKQETATL